MKEKKTKMKGNMCKLYLRLIERAFFCGRAIVIKLTPMITVDICDNHGDSYDILYFTHKIKALKLSEGNSSDYPLE